MEAHLSFLWTWIFVLFFTSVCSGQEIAKINLESTVFVALAGQDLHIDGEVQVPANQSSHILRCLDPFRKQIYSFPIPPATTHQEVKLGLELKNVRSSGEYTCQYETAEVYFFIRVRDHGYTELQMMDNIVEFTVAIITGVLLAFSVAGSVYVFRGHWKQCITDTPGKRKQSREKRKKRKMEKDNAATIAAPSQSFYASLEPRSRSIYDVLDHSAANTGADHGKAKPKKKEPKNTMVQTTQPQQEGVFESVYENF